jgi:hypothetical protein
MLPIVPVAAWWIPAASTTPFRPVVSRDLPNGEFRLVATHLTRVVDVPAIVHQRPPGRISSLRAALADG